MKNLQDIQNNYTTDDSLNETELEFLSYYLKNEEEKREFLRTFMYILNVGTGDAQFESKQYQNSEHINESILGNIITFVRGKTAISSYYKGLMKAAKIFIQENKETKIAW